jgi:hypothetical protein
MAYRVNTARRGKMAFGMRDLDGEVAGTPDLIGWVDGRIAAWEIKLPGEKLSPEQEARLKAIHDGGGLAVVVHSIDEAVEAVKSYRAAIRRGERFLAGLHKTEQEMAAKQEAAVTAWLQRHADQCDKADADSCGYQGPSSAGLNQAIEDVEGLKGALGWTLDEL